MPYAEPAFTSFLDLFTYVNTGSGSVYGILALISIWVVLFLSLKYYATEAAMVTASFVTAVVAIMLVIVGIVPEVVLVFVAIIAAISIIVAFVGDKKQGMTI